MVEFLHTGQYDEDSDSVNSEDEDDEDDEGKPSHTSDEDEYIGKLIRPPEVQIQGVREGEQCGTHTDCS